MLKSFQRLCFKVALDQEQEPWALKKGWTDGDIWGVDSGELIY